MAFVSFISRCWKVLYKCATEQVMFQEDILIMYNWIINATAGNQASGMRNKISPHLVSSRSTMLQYALHNPSGGTITLH